MGLFNSKTRQVEDYAYEDFTYKQWPPFPTNQHVERQETSTSDNLSKPTTLITIGAAFVAANLLLAIALKPDRPMLVNDHMCGIPTGGKEECYFDCESTFNLKEPNVRLIKDLSCLDDCFEDDLGQECLSELLKDVKEKGVCNLGSNSGINPGSGVYNTTSCAQYSPDPLIPNISKGTCSPETEGALIQDKCRNYIRQQPPIILNTATELISSACSKNVSQAYVEVKIKYTSTTCGCTQEQFDTVTANITVEIPVIPKIVELPPFLWNNNQAHTQTTKTDVKAINVPKNNRTLPVTFGFPEGTVEFGLQFDFNRTRNRYSWICSLRSTDLNADHFCAVTILSVPPKPTVIVGSAHCTYLCKNGKHRVSSCCCRTDTTDCRNDTATCGNNPRVAEMEEADSQILCGEWEIGTTPPALSGETNNLALEVLEIVRHPKFNAKEGPIAGYDIAIFKVNDDKLKRNQRYKINPVCFPQRESNMQNDDGTIKALFGIQASWAEPPPYNFILKNAPGYVPLYRDFFKQWHYRMDIFNCTDPQTTSSNFTLKCPSNTAYPPATICAKDFAKSACFTSGESGSPLMVQDKIGRFFAQGLLSFVKGRGCDIYSNNPSAYTKLSCFLPWIAKQYEMDYEPEVEFDPTCTVGTPATISKNESCLVPQDAWFLPSGQKTEKRKEKCQNTPSSLQEDFAGERDCIFPFYYNERKYNECIVFTEDGFVYPAFRCPIYNIRRKRDGLNDFRIKINNTQNQNKDCPGFACQIFQTSNYCAVNPSDPNTELDESITDCDPAERRAPFSVCKNNCPGVGALGIIGGGALAFIATAAVGQALLAPAGIGALGIVGAGGFAGSGSQICMCPFCRSPFCCTQATNQRCRLQNVGGRFACPSRC